MSDLPAVPEPHELRASNDDRERVAKILNDAMAEGRITVSELEERLDLVYAAKTLGELQPLIRDLPVPHGTSLPAPLPANAVTLHDERIGGRGTSSAAISVLSGTERKGTWTVPPTFNAFAMMGGILIDLTKARFEEQETTIQVFALMGGVDILVPDDINLSVTGFGFMGAFEDEARVSCDQPGAPIVKITGFAMMAGVGVRRPKPKKDKKKLDAQTDRPQLES